MRRLILGFIVGLTVQLASPALAAASSVNVSASISGTTAQLTVSGSADSCDGLCSSMTATVVVQPEDATDAAYSIAPDCITDEGDTVSGSSSVTTTGGSFTFNTNVVESGGTYYACAYLDQTFDGITETLAESSPTVFTIAAQACPSGTAQDLTLSASALVAYGRNAVITVSGGAVSSGTLTLRKPNSAPFDTYQLTADDLIDIYEGFDNSWAFQLGTGQTRTLVTLTYTENPSTADTVLSCSQSTSVMVAGEIGTTPTASFTSKPPYYLNSHASAAVLFKATAGCTKTRVGVHVSVSVSGHGANLKATNDDICAKYWTRTGTVRGIGLSTGRGTNVAGVGFAARTANGTYHVTVRKNGRIIKRGRIIASYKYIPARRIPQSNFDAYVNVCIADNLPTYAADNELWCTVPARHISKLVLRASK